MSSFYLASMEVSYSSVLAIMDNLWFHQIILLAEPFTAIYEKSVVQSPSLIDVSDDHSEEGSFSADSFTSSATSQDDGLEEEKPLEHTETKTGSKSSFPLIQKQRKSTSYLNDKGQKIQRFLNSKILRDLELLELKGFLDLGFDFKKDRLSPRTMIVIPGLQRLGELTTIINTSEYRAKSDYLDSKEYEVQKDQIIVAKPYLSDAWTVNKPESPLLRLRMARVSNAQDMKNCLKLWARTVASSIQSVR